MRRLTPFAVIAAVILLLLAAPRPGASQSTPAASPEPIIRETLGHLASAVAPDRELLMTRRTFAAGADSGAQPAPGPVVLYVETGPVTFLVGEGGAALATIGGQEQEIVAGDEITLETGDVVTYDEGVIHTVRNPGPGEAVTIEARFNPAATPAATPAP